MPISWQDADKQFFAGVNWSDLHTLTKTIGTGQSVENAGNLYMLNPVTPLPVSEFPLSPEKQTKEAQKLTAQKKEIAMMQAWLKAKP